MEKQAFGRVFKSERVKRFNSQVEFIKDFTEKTGIKLLKSAVSMYERGIRFPEQNLLDAMCNYFGVTMDFLAGRSTANMDTVYKSVDSLGDLFDRLSKQDREQAKKYMEFLLLTKEGEHWEPNNLKSGKTEDIEKQSE